MKTNNPLDFQFTKSLWLLIIFVTTIIVAFYIWMRPKFNGSDDLVYMSHAGSVAHGTFILTSDHFANRFGVFIPTAGIFKLFGVTTWSSTLWPLICSIVLVVAVAIFAFRCYGLRTAIFSSCLLIFNPLELSLTSVLMADLIVGMFGFLAVISIAQGRQSKSWRSQILFSLVSCVSLSMGILTKQTAIYSVYFCGFLLMLDTISRKNTRFWCSFIIAGTVASGIYLLVYYLITGDPLYTLSGIEAGHNKSIWSYAESKSEVDAFHAKELGVIWSAAPLVQRLTVSPIFLLVGTPGIFILLALTVASLGPLRNIYDEENRPTTVYFAAYGLTILVSFWFGSTSFHRYNPLPLFSRMLVAILPPLALCGGRTLDRLCVQDSCTQTVKKRTSLILCALLSGAGILLLVKDLAYFYSDCQSFWLGGTVRFLLFHCLDEKLYAITAGLFAMSLLSCNARQDKKCLKGAFLSILFVGVIAAYSCLLVVRKEIGETPGQVAEREVTEYALHKLPSESTILTSPRSVSIAVYYNGFKEPDHIHLIAWKPNQQYLSDKLHPLYILINEPREKWFSLAYHDNFSNYVLQRCDAWRLIFYRGSVKLYVSE